MRRFTNIMLFFIMILLIGAIAVFGIAIYANMTNTTTSDVLYTINSIITIGKEKDEINTTVVTNEDITIEKNRSSDEVNDRYFYEQLTDTQKLIYDGLQENKENLRNGKYKIKYGEKFTDILNEDGGSEKLGQDYQSAVETFLYDNPDIFYIDANKLYLSIKTSKTIFKTTYNVYIGPAEDKTYYIDGFETEMQVNTAISEIDIEIY